VFVGHLAASLVGKRANPTVSLVWFIVAANFIDLIWPLFLLAGLEVVEVDPGNTAFTALDFVSYPWTHSLLMTIVWGALLGGLAAWRGVPRKAAWWIGGLVVSHWVLDFITHRPDLPLWPGGEARVGLGLWNSIPATFTVELLLWGGAVVAWFAANKPRGVHGQFAFWSFVVVSTGLWAVTPFEPPPPDASAIAYFSLFGWIIVPWAWWIERTSQSR
jgi:hypothetical protein